MELLCQRVLLVLSAGSSKFLPSSKGKVVPTDAPESVSIRLSALDFVILAHLH